MSSQFVAGKGRLQIGGVICFPDGTIKQPLSLEASVSGQARRRFVPLPCELQHDNATRNSLANAVVDLFDLGSGNAEGRIKLLTAGGVTLLATVLMGNPAFTTATNGISQGVDLPWTDTSAVGTGIASIFQAVDRDDNLILQGDVAISGGEINFPQLEIAVDDIVKILSASYTAPP